MNTIRNDIEAEQHSSRRSTVTLCSVAGGAAIGLMLVALATLDGAKDQPAVLLDNAPAEAAPPAAHVAALDAGVDWSKVELAGDPGPMAIAAYAP